MAKSPLPEPELHGLARQIGRLCLHEPEAPASLNQLKADFLRAASENTLSQVPARMWDRLPMVLEYGEGPLLGTDPGVIAGLARYLSERRAHRCVRNLASYYFREFKREHAPFANAVAILRDVLLTRATTYPYLSRAQQRFNLFDPRLGPEMAAKRCLDSSDPIAKTLEDVGAPPGSLTGKFGVAALGEALTAVSEALTSPSA